MSNLKITTTLTSSKGREEACTKALDEQSSTYCHAEEAVFTNVSKKGRVPSQFETEPHAVEVKLNLESSCKQQVFPLKYLLVFGGLIFFTAHRI